MTNESKTPEGSDSGEPEREGNAQYKTEVESEVDWISEETTQKIKDFVLEERKGWYNKYQAVLKEKLIKQGYIENEISFVRRVNIVKVEDGNVKYTMYVDVETQHFFEHKSEGYEKTYFILEDATKERNERGDSVRAMVAKDKAVVIEAEQKKEVETETKEEVKEDDTEKKQRERQEKINQLRKYIASETEKIEVAQKIDLAVQVKRCQKNISNYETEIKLLKKGYDVLDEDVYEYEEDEYYDFSNLSGYNGYIPLEALKIAQQFLKDVPDAKLKICEEVEDDDPILYGVVVGTIVVRLYHW